LRRAAGLWPRIASFSSLVDAAHEAARGKRTTGSAARFLERVEPEALALERELQGGHWQPGRCSTFQVHDPKTRTITAVPFRDQVVHHALMAELAPLLERRMIADSYACRRGKGTHAALRRAHGFVRRFGHFLKLDVRSFFASVRHDVVLDAVARVTKDNQVLTLCRTILAGPPGRVSTGVGLPIGALTSQWFANAVLDRLDRFVKEELRVPGYVRYMDDMVLFADHRRVLAAAKDAVERHLADPLNLVLKHRATMLAPTTVGLPFLGWLLFRGTVRLRPANLRRSLWRLRIRRWELEHGLRDETSYRQGVASVFALLSHGNTTRLRRRLCARHRLDL
jgi:hypothetical protein